MNAESSDQNDAEEATNLSPFELLQSYTQQVNDKSDLSQTEQMVTPHFLMFNAANEGFLVPVSDVNSVIRDKPVIKSLPFSPPWFEGLSSIRNEVVSVISFAQLWGEGKKSDGKRNHYILLRGAMEGFMFEVDDLVGIKPLEIQEDTHKRFVDGYAYSEGKKWQLINTSMLLEIELKNQMEL